jgi:hypothetical protein
MVWEIILMVLKVLLSENIPFPYISSLVQDLYFLAKASPFFYILSVIRGFLAAFLLRILRPTRRRH